MRTHAVLLHANRGARLRPGRGCQPPAVVLSLPERHAILLPRRDRKSTRLNSSHRCISYAVFCLTKVVTSRRIELGDEVATRDVQRRPLVEVAGQSDAEVSRDLRFFFKAEGGPGDPPACPPAVFHD